MNRTYIVKLENGDIWQFKYNLNGFLIAYNILEGEISQRHSDWLFVKGKFPYLEDHIKDWIKNQKTLTIEVGEPDLSFDSLWNLYDHKVSKHDSIKAFNKLSQSDQIKCFMTVPGYKKYVFRKNIGTAHLSTFINRQYYNDDWLKAK